MTITSAPLPITERMLLDIWRAGQQRRRPWALVETRDGKLLIYQADQSYEGRLLGIYDRPTVPQLREDLMHT